MDWMQSVQRALNYIEANLLGEALDNDLVARQAYSSSANFQRVFSLVTGVTVAEYIRLRKLTLAGEDLAASGMRVIDAALKYGYETPESFAKAFARFHGIPPSEARHNPAGLRAFKPIFLRIEVQGGFNVRTKMIPNIPPLANSWFGENYPFGGVARYIMGCLGEMTLSDYALIAGISGDIFAQAYALGTEKQDSPSGYYLGLHGYPSVFDTLGYAAEAFSEATYQSDLARFYAKITASIDRGIPVAWLRRGPAAAIVGYEGDGRTLLFLSGGSTEPERVTLDEAYFQADGQQALGWIVMGKKTRDVSIRRLYRDAILRLPTLLTQRTDAYVLGAEAFRAWARDIERGAFAAMTHEAFDENFFAYDVYVANLSTNSGGCQSFLEKAQALNPDLAFLADVRRQYRATNYLWNGGYWVKDVLTPEERADLLRQYGPESLESLGGGFGCKLETLQSEAKRTPIVRQIRRLAACYDEVVRILRAHLPGG